MQEYRTAANATQAAIRAGSKLGETGTARTGTPTGGWDEAPMIQE